MADTTPTLVGDHAGFELKNSLKGVLDVTMALLACEHSAGVVSCLIGLEAARDRCRLF